MHSHANGFVAMLMNIALFANVLNYSDIFKIGVNDTLIVYFQVMNS